MAPNESSVMSLLGYVFLQNARPDKAAAILAALDVMEPGQPRVLRSLVVAQLRSGKPGLALETLDRLAMAGGVDAAFHLLRTQALTGLQRTDEAAVAIKTFLRLRDGAAPESQARV